MFKTTEPIIKQSTARCERIILVVFYTEDLKVEKEAEFWTGSTWARTSSLLLKII